MRHCELWIRFKDQSFIVKISANLYLKRKLYVQWASRGSRTTSNCGSKFIKR